MFSFIVFWLGIWGFLMFFHYQEVKSANCGLCEIDSSLQQCRMSVCADVIEP